MEEYMLPCMNKQLFGIDCPGCGMQRAIQFIFNGEFLNAFKMFPAIYSLALLALFLVLHLFDKSRDYQKLIIGTAILNAAIVIISYIYKMT